MTQEIVWRIQTKDENYFGENRSYLMLGKSAAVVSSRALKMSKVETGRYERVSKPYITSVERIGRLS